MRIANISNPLQDFLSTGMWLPLLVDIQNTFSQILSNFYFFCTLIITLYYITCVLLYFYLCERTLRLLSVKSAILIKFTYLLTTNVTHV